MIQQIKNRRSYRGTYYDIRVPRSDLITIMEAGLSAPSGCNKQTTSLIAVDDPFVLQELKAQIQPPICESAPAIIVVLTQQIYAYRDKTFYIQDYSAAIENMLLAINMLGYESCWYEGHITDDDNIAGKLAKVLHVPKDYQVVCLLPVGVAKEQVISPEKKSFEQRAWFNLFGQHK